MVEVRTASGLVSCAAFMRTSSGLVECGPQFRTADGVVDCGNSVGALVVSASPNAVSGAISRNRPGSVPTNSTTVSVTGGKAPYTFAWGAQSGWTVANPSAATTNFTTVVGPDSSDSATFVCTVTDARGATGTASVTAEASNYYQGGSGGIID